MNSESQSERSKSIKKNLTWLLLAALATTTFFLFSACQKTDKHTDLTNVHIDGFQLGVLFQDIDTSIYTPSDRYTVDSDTVAFEEIRITVVEGRIIKIDANITDVLVSVGGTQGPLVVDDITNVLGEHYSDAWHDREQGLRVRTYVDSDNQIEARFIYNRHDNVLVWVQLALEG